MKKISLYGFAAIVALSVAACDNYEEPNPTPQVNPQEPILKVDDVTVASSVTTESYDLKALNDEGKNIVLSTVTCDVLPEGYEFLADAEISANDFARSASVPASVVVDGEGTYSVVVNPDDLQGVYYANISKGPKAKDIKIRYNLKTKTGNQIAYVGSPENFYGPYDMTVVPFPSSLVIEENYYLLGTINGWSVADAIKFNHSDANQYDDPVFTIKVDISAEDAAAGWWWKIVPESTYVTGNWVDGDNTAYGVAENGSEELSGLLVGRTATEDCGAGCIKTDGQLLLTINLEEGTYEFTSAVDYLYTPGDANGWFQINSQLLSTNNYSDYSGYALLSPNGFKFSSAPDWDHVNYGAGAAEGDLSTDGGAGNLSVAEAGLYYCKVNTASLKYSATLVSTIGVIGDATPAGWDASTPLTTTDNLIWTGTIEFKGGNFKFRANDGWDINLGGDLQNLTQDGADIASPGEGKYDVTLDLSKLPYSCSLVKK